MPLLPCVSFPPYSTFFPAIVHSQKSYVDTSVSDIDDISKKWIFKSSTRVKRGQGKEGAALEQNNNVEEGEMDVDDEDARSPPLSNKKKKSH